MRRVLFALAALFCLHVAAFAQSIGGNASLSVTTTTSNVALPVSGASYPALMIVPAIGTSTEVFYTVGNANTLAALTTSPSLPSGGICFPSVGPNTYVAAITATGSATLRLTQMTQCPQNFNAVGQSSGGVVSVSPYSYTPLSPGQHNLAITASTALTVPPTATYATICGSSVLIRYTTDGTTTPTASAGQPLQAGSCVALSGATVLANFRAIQSAANGTLDVEYFK